MEKFGFIGMGNMGTAMLKGAVKAFNKENIIFTRKNSEKMQEITRETGVEHVSNNRECVKNAKYVVLAVKPQMYQEVLTDIKDEVTAEHIIISIAPGITIDSISEKLGSKARVVRAMPNTPALVGEGMTGICYDEKLFTEEEKGRIKEFFESFGKVMVISEKIMSSVVCASGSSPAYVYMFIEALADGAVKYGMPRNMAYEFVAQTVLGSAKMVLETKEHPGKLKDNVCSPGGTTIAGVAALEENGFRNAVIKACDKCYEKCESIK